MVHISIKLCFWDWCVFCIFQAASNWLFMLVKKSMGRHSCFEIGNPSQLIIELPPFLLNSSTYLHLPWISYNRALHIQDEQTHGVSVVRRSVCGLGMVADQYDLLAWAGWLSWQTRVIQHSRKSLALKIERYPGQAADKQHEDKFYHHTCFNVSVRQSWEIHFKLSWILNQSCYKIMLIESLTSVSLFV